MFRTSDIVLIAVMVSAAAFTYKTKHEAENRLDEVRRIESADQTRGRHDHPAEGRLEPADPAVAPAEAVGNLSGRLALQPVEAHQIVGIDELPLRPSRSRICRRERLGGMADSGQDHNVTGGSRPMIGKWRKTAEGSRPEAASCDRRGRRAEGDGRQDEEPRR